LAPFGEHLPTQAQNTADALVRKKRAKRARSKSFNKLAADETPCAMQHVKKVDTRILIDVWLAGSRPGTTSSLAVRRRLRHPPLPDQRHACSAPRGSSPAAVGNAWTSVQADCDRRPLASQRKVCSGSTTDARRTSLTDRSARWSRRSGRGRWRCVTHPSCVRATSTPAPRRLDLVAALLRAVCRPRRWMAKGGGWPP